MPEFKDQRLQIEQGFISYANSTISGSLILTTGSLVFPDLTSQSTAAGGSPPVPEGGGSPSGNDGDIQYNNNGAFGGVPTLIYTAGLLKATGSFSGSFIGDGSGLTGVGGSTSTGSLLTTASVSLNTITFTKGDGSTFPITINTGSAASGTGFPFSGSAVITGSLLVSGSGATVSGSVSINTQNDVVIQGGGKLSLGAVGGDEGGEFLIGKPATNTSISGSGVVVDVYQNRLRIFEEASPNRGGYYDITQLGNGVSTDLRTATTASYISPNNALLSGLPYTVYANTSALTVPNDTNANTVATITIPSSSIRVGSMIRVNSLSSIGTIVAASFQCLTTQSAFIDTSGFFYDSAIRQSTLYQNIMIKVASTTTLKSFPTIRTAFQGPVTTAIITKTIPNITTNDINLYMNVQKGGSAYAFSQDILNVEVIY